MRQDMALGFAAMALVAGVASSPASIVVKDKAPVTQASEVATEPIATRPIEVKAKQSPVISYCPITSKKVYGPTIFMITDGNCKWCDKWWGLFASVLKGLGWRVEAISTDNPIVSSYPTFSIYDLKKWHRHNGFMTMEDLNRLLGRVVQEVKAPLSNRLSTSELRSLIAAIRPGGWRGPVYADVAPRSQAKQHLVSSEHGFSWDQVSGLTLNEALILHDLAPGHGNKIKPYRTSPQPVPQVVASNGCANGGCANQVSSRSFRFGWW